MTDRLAVPLHRGEIGLVEWLVGHNCVVYESRWMGGLALHPLLYLCHSVLGHEWQ